MKLWRTLGISLAVALALLLAAGGSASALVEQLTLDELTAKADAILVGEVTDIACYEEGKGDIYTMVTLSVEQTIKGESEGEVTIKVPGGEVDGHWLWVSDTPSFQLGERTVVFLEEVDNTFEVCGWYQGKFTVEDNRVLERDQSLTSFMADVCQTMEAQDGPPEKGTKGTSGKISVRQFDMVLESPVESKALEPGKPTEFDVGWEIIGTEDFEGTFPGVWTVFANSGPDAYWGKDGSRYHGGSNSAFCAKNGTAGVDPPANYPNNVDAWMVSGPFSLADATDAKVDFWLWLDSELNYDGIMCAASINGTNFSSPGAWSGDSAGWVSESFDLKDAGSLGNLCGQAEVWIAFIFQSDSTVTDYGAFVDDVVLQKYVGGGTVPQITSISPDTGSGGTGLEVTITGTDFGATQDTSTVTFWRGGGYPASEATIVSWDDTQIVCEVPGTSSGSTSNGVKVTTAVGPSNNYPFTATFSYAGYKWGGTDPVGETLLINPNTADCTGEEWAFGDAMQTWNDVDTANFYFEYGGLTSATDRSENGFNEIMWVNYDTGSIATCSIWGFDSTITECDVRFNDPGFTWDTSGTPSATQMDVQNVAVHELGHWLCLLDLYGDPDSAKTMYGYGDYGAIEARTLEPQDEAGIQWIYPGTGTRGQYHISVTNNDDDNLTVSFKADTDAGYESYRQVDVPLGQTVNSWWEVVPNGSRQVSIKWTDPDKGTEDILNSAWLSVPIEGDTEFAFTIPPFPSAAPTVTSVTPNSGNQGDTLNATIAGTNFTGATAVSFGADITVSVTAVTDTQITANISIAGGATLGPRDVSVTTPGGTGTLYDGFTVTAAAGPTVTSVTPNSGNQGDTLNATIAGTNFTGATDVSFGADITVSAPTVVSSTQITVDITIAGGATLGTRNVSVTTPEGTGTLTDGFTVTGAQTLVSISPPNQTVPLEQSFTVNVDIIPSEPTLGAQFDMSFDPSLLTCNSVTEGDLYNVNDIGGANPTTWQPPTIDNGAGTITGAACAVSGGVPVSNPGTFATISFTAKDVPGTSVLDLSDVVVGDASADPLPVTVTDGSVTVGITGDVNGDGRVNVLDMIRIGMRWGDIGPPGWISEDVKQDGVINVLDMILVGMNWTG